MTLPTLEERPSGFGSLVQGLGVGMQQSLPSIQEMIMHSHQQKIRQKQISSILGMGSSPNAMEESGISSGNESSGMEITPEKIMAISQIDPQMASTMSKIYAGQERERVSKQKLSEEKILGQDSFNRMVELLNEGNLGMGSGLKGQAFGGKTAEDVGEFNSLSGALESMLVDRVSRGTLSNSRFKYITETLLPKPTDRQSTIRGKMKGLARELGLDSAILQKNNSKNKGSSQQFVLMEDPNGIVRKIPKNKAIEAQRAGGKLIK
jgi:hypothetical protein